MFIDDRSRCIWENRRDGSTIALSMSNVTALLWDVCLYFWVMWAGLSQWDCTTTRLCRLCTRKWTSAGGINGICRQLTPHDPAYSDMLRSVGQSAPRLDPTDAKMTSLTVFPLTSYWLVAIRCRRRYSKPFIVSSSHRQFNIDVVLATNCSSSSSSNDRD